MSENTNLQSTLRPGEVVEGKYRIIALLAEGGMGAVYHAVQEPLGRDVALKILKNPQDSDEQRQLQYKRFFREAALCSRLNHPNTVMIFDYGNLTSIDGFFLVMEFLKGQPLRDLLNERGRLSVSLALHVAIQIASSLADAHKAGVVHRDLKPPNIMLVERGDDKHFVKVVDFGLVKDLNQGDDELTAENTLIGSPMYMAPERFLYHNADSAVVDVYSLGIMLYEMLVGRPPFVRDSDSTVHRIMMAHIQEDPPPMRAFDPKLQLPPGLESIVMKCLAKQPGERFESMDALIKALKGCLQAGASESSAFYAALAEDSGEHLRKSANYDSTPVNDHGTENTAIVTPSGMAASQQNQAPSLITSVPSIEVPKPATQPETQTLSEPAKSGSKAPLIAIGIAALVLVGLLAAFIFKTPAPANVSVDSDPQGASVLVNGALTGTTPTQIQVPVGEEVNLQLSAGDHETLEHRFVANQDTNLSLKLTPIIAEKTPEEPPLEIAPEVVPVEPEVVEPPKEKVAEKPKTKVKKDVQKTQKSKTPKEEPKKDDINMNR
jgi:serine/threonine-protein kinase